ncbi:MAG: M15 family metallopeptidase [Prochloraceae cyanobacterium]|nr:M15 family metallopeptidase [Prochloraceae cyanobacterium]
MVAIAKLEDCPKITIQECGEPLIAIPLEKFAVTTPHPYEKLGANYGGRSPYYLRQGVLKALIAAQSKLQEDYSGWQIEIFDAYRPVEVQQFMVDYTFASVVRDRRLNLQKLSAQQRQSIWEQVYKFWAVPSLDPRTPPPHSTGAAVDITLVDHRGETLDMGSEIDEISPRSHSNYYANSKTKERRQYHARRELLHQIMRKAGFRRNPGEWWHFSLGDRMWAWLCNRENPANNAIARYGRF